jgi:hypothetical protein
MKICAMNTTSSLLEFQLVRCGINRVHQILLQTRQLVAHPEPQFRVPDSQALGL